MIIFSLRKVAISSVHHGKPERVKSTILTGVLILLKSPQDPAPNICVWEGGKREKERKRKRRVVVESVLIELSE